MDLSLQTLKAAVAGRIPAMLIGSPGTTKTAAVRQLAKDMGYDLITIVPSRMEAPDISGFPTKGELLIDGKPISVTQYAPQAWQIEILQKRKVILFLDEFSNAHPSVRASLLSFIQDRQFANGDYFPEETIIVGAMNPTDTAADGYELDPATSNRLLFIQWRPSVQSWLDGFIVNWGNEVSDNENAWRSRIHRFITQNPSYLHREDKKPLNPTSFNMLNDSTSHTVMQGAWPSRRSWNNVAIVLGASASLPGAVEDDIITGLIGPSTAHSFRDWLDKHDSVDVNAIINKFNAKKHNEAFFKSLNIDDWNRLLSEGLEMKNVDNVHNILTVFKMLTKIDKASYAGPYLVDLSRLLQGGIDAQFSKKNGEEAHKELRAEMLKVIRLFNTITQRENENKVGK